MEQNHMPPALPHEKTPARPAPDPAPPRIAVYAAALALLFATLAYPTIFVYETGIAGINVTLCAAAAYCAYFLSMRTLRGPDYRRGWPLFPVNALLALAPMLYSVPELTVFTTLALFALIPLHFSWMSGSNWAELLGASRIYQGAYDIFARPFAYISDSCRATMAGGSGKGALRGILLSLAGLAVGLPVILIVLVLLASADERFSDILSDLTWNIDVPQIAFILVAAFLSLFPLLSALYSLVLGKKVGREQAARKENSGIHPIPVYALLAAFNLILALFAAVQLGRLFERQDVFEYSRYAHQGFFPMLAAALICYGVQSVCMHFTKKQSSDTPLRVLVSAMAASLLVMMASAFKAIVQYQAAYGLSRLRLYVTICIAALFVLLIVTLIRIWTKRPLRLFAATVLVAALLCVNYMGIDRTIAAFNISLSERTGRALDIDYLLELSPDALLVCADSQLIMGDPELNARVQRGLRQNIWIDDWRVWNIGRARAAARE